MARRRKALGLTVERASAAARVSAQYLSQVESGQRPPSRRLAQRLERVYRKPGEYTQPRYRFEGPGRRPAPEAARQALREIRRATALDGPAPQQPAAAPRHPWPEQRPVLDDVLWPIGLHLGAEARVEVEQLEALRGEDDFLWQTLNQMSFDSWSEKRLTVRLLGAGHLMTVAPDSVGCAVQVVSGRTGRNLGAVAQAAIVLNCDELSAVVWPQATVQIGTSHRRCDFLAVVSVRGMKRTVCIEVVSPDTHPDDRRDQARADHLGIRVGRLWVEHLGRADLLAGLRRWMSATLPQAPSAIAE